VAGVKTHNGTKAYDWNLLTSKRIIHDRINATLVLLVLADDNKSLFAFERPAENAIFTLKRDTLTYNERHYRIDGKGLDTANSLTPLPVYQEFWHSWRTFNPETERSN
jgi:hypothetical protein